MSKMNKKGQEEAILAILSIFIIISIIVIYFFLASDNKISEEYGVSVSNNFKIEILNLAREQINYKGEEYSAIDLFYIYLKDSEDVALKNLLQIKIDEYSEFSSCDYIREHGIIFPILVNKANINELDDVKNKVVFETENPEKIIIFTSKYCFKEEAGFFL
ncbi:hypothetical protein J4405_03505 [Candidatus Woesearchaeota archaeon]|nr:hypothetical protein [Candidatus Woesearchaeota archaeon]